MTWSEEDSAIYRAIAAVAVPRRDEMIGGAGCGGAVRAGRAD